MASFSPEYLSLLGWWSSMYFVISLIWWCKMQGWQYWMCREREACLNDNECPHGRRCLQRSSWSVLHTNMPIRGPCTTLCMNHESPSAQTSMSFQISFAPPDRLEATCNQCCWHCAITSKFLRHDVGNTLMNQQEKLLQESKVFTEGETIGVRQQYSSGIEFWNPDASANAPPLDRHSHVVADVIVAG